MARPKLRGTDEAFASRLLGKQVTRTNALESLTIAGCVRGLSTRDVEASLADALGAEAALSRSTVSRVCAAIQDEFDTWAKRSLADVELEYLDLDASHFRVHDGAPGLISAGAQVFPGNLRQRCVIHRSWNLIANVSKLDLPPVGGHLD